MKKAQQIYSKTFTFQTPCTFHANPSDEIPAFEEAFDTVSLRKFFQDRESTNSQSACSPRKDTSMLEETHSQAATDQRDSLLSPMPYSVNRSNSDTVLTDSRFNLRFNFNLNTPLFTSKALTTSSKKCQPFTIVRAQRTNSTPSFGGNSQSILPRNNPDYLSMFEPITVPFKKQDLYPTYQPSYPQFFQPIENDLISLMKTESIDKLIKKKKVFTIERNVKPGRKSLNRKREASFKHQESSPPILKHVKTNKVSSEVDNFDSFFPDLSEYLKSFEGADPFDL